jgi:hypothetical protein
LNCVRVIEGLGKLVVEKNAAHLQDDSWAWALAQNVFKHVYNSFVYMLLLRLHYSKNVHTLKTFYCRIWLVHIFL